MSSKTFARFRVISIATFLTGVVSVGWAYSVHKRNTPRIQPRKGFTLESRNTAMPILSRQPGTREITHSATTRYQRSDGTFKQVKVYYNANDEVIKKEILFGIPGQGVFKINNSKGPLQFLSSMQPKETTSFARVSDGHAQPNFVRDDWVQGHQTYVLRFPDREGGYVEMYCAPEFDGEPLRTVSVSAAGVSIEEVVRISLGDPDVSMFGPLPNLLVSYDLFKHKITINEQAGNHEIAEGMQRQLDEQIAKQMEEKASER